MVVNLFEKAIQRVIPHEFTNFAELSFMGDLTKGCSAFIQNDPLTKQRMLSEPKNIQPVDLVLFWDHTTQLPIGKELFSYIRGKGYETVKEAHISLLVKTIGYFPDDRLTKCGIPANVGIILPSSLKQTYTNEKGEKCFACIGRGGIKHIHRSLDLIPVNDEANLKKRSWCLILRKVKSDILDLLSSS